MQRYRAIRGGCGRRAKRRERRSARNLPRLRGLRLLITGQSVRSCEILFANSTLPDTRHIYRTVLSLPIKLNVLRNSDALWTSRWRQIVRAGCWGEGRGELRETAAIATKAAERGTRLPRGDIGARRWSRASRRRSRLSPVICRQVNRLTLDGHLTDCRERQQAPGTAPATGRVTPVFACVATEEKQQRPLWTAPKINGKVLGWIGKRCGTTTLNMGCEGTTYKMLY